MRTRQKLTVAGAFTLATTAIGGGAFVTSHAMADATPPAQATLTIVSMAVASHDVVKCTYDDVTLPSITLSAAGTAQFGTVTGQPGSINIFTGSGPIDATGEPFPALVTTQAQPIGGGVAVATEPGAAGSVLSPGPDGGPGLGPTGVAAVFDTADARLGTAQECAALERRLATGNNAP